MRLRTPSASGGKDTAQGVLAVPAPYGACLERAGEPPGGGYGRPMPVPIVRVVVEVVAAVRTRRAGSTAAYQRALAPSAAPNSRTCSRERRTPTGARFTPGFSTAPTATPKPSPTPSEISASPSRERAAPASPSSGARWTPRQWQRSYPAAIRSNRLSALACGGLYVPSAGCAGPCICFMWGV